MLRDFFVLLITTIVFTQGKTILFLGCWQKSPVIALNGLAEEMVRRGHRVLFATPDEDRHLVSSVASGVEWLSAGPAPASVTVPALLIEDLWWGEGEYAIAMHAHLLPVLSTPEYRPDLIAFDVLSIAGEGLAHALRVPSVGIAPHLIDLPFVGSEPTAAYPGIISGLAPHSMRLPDMLFNAVLTTVERYVLPAVRGLMQRHARAAMGLPAEWGYASNVYGRTKLTIIGNIPGFELARALPPTVQLTGPFLPRSYRPPPAPLREWLDASATPLVYVSIGTNSNWTPDTMSAMLNALLDGATAGTFRALLCVRPAHRAMMDPALLTRAAAASDVLRIEEFVEQLAILSHNTTAVFVTHAGLSSVLEALYHGVPLVLMPMMLVADQPTNAARCVELGVGVWLDRRSEEISATSVSTAIARVLNEPSFEDNARRWQGLIHALRGRERAGDLLEASLAPLSLADELQPPRWLWEVDVVFGVVMLGAAWGMWRFVRRCCCKTHTKVGVEKSKRA